VRYDAVVTEAEIDKGWQPMRDCDSDDAYVRCPWPPSAKVEILACWQLASLTSVPREAFLTPASLEPRRAGTQVPDQSYGGGVRLPGV
jgi:hypothetical protein